MIFKSIFSEVSKIYTFFLSKFYKKKIISRGPPVRASRTPRTTVWETLVYGIMGWGLFVCMYLCIHVLEVCGYSIFATRPVPVPQDRYPYPYPTRTQNYYPTRPVPAGIPVPVTVKPSMHSICSYHANVPATRHEL